MKILFLCHRLPFPPKRGGKIRPFNIIKHFSESGHSVTVGSLARSAEEEYEGQGLRDYCDKVIMGRIGPISAVAQMILRLPSSIPSSMGFFYSRSLHRDVEAELASNQFDLVFVHCSSAAQYARAAHGLPTVLDFGDMDSQKWLDYSKFRRFPLSAGYWVEGSKLTREERRLARTFDLCTCTTRAELDTLERLNAAKLTGWFPNGVDSEYFAPGTDDYDPAQICFVGRMDYYPNQQAVQFFCNEVLPRIQNRHSGARLVIVGAEPSSEIRNLGNRPAVTVTGTVEDVRPYVQRSALTVAPLSIARGTQNKILESMAMGVPVVCSARAAGGVDARPGEDLLVADSADEVAENVLRVLNQPDLRSQLASTARARVKTHHDWSASMEKLDAILQSAGI